ncbi:FAD-dependent thymidylate synthase [Thermodesulfobacterium sp. TA1]|uniref:FAD-dependent thymidylate synthase n=1 Tax=Thermodesulfobacterium sp. TA1 TaxID=2234087 RepID=UPI001231A194|nr:FAD-dependent thymidylate synthase [Thermodesulfobacterium sp. TA1]QER41997.1 FAD-dependent thymidylate synthase [Thermodesulfobacterium sp. TA1]
MKLSDLRETQKELISIVFENSDFKALTDFLFFSYLGARICYASSHPLALFSEEKFKNFEAFKSFLLHLKKLEHYSVFAHTPVFVDTANIKDTHKLLLAQVYFKVFWDEVNQQALFNLRHLAENLSDEAFAKVIETPPDLSGIKITYFRKQDLLYKGSLLDFTYQILEKNPDNLFTEPEIIIIQQEKPYPFNWIGVITHNFSRIFSHQFVRHTWLNFNQRSHRYTEVDKFVVPGVFKPTHVEIYKQVIQQSMGYYKEFMKEVKKESARFLVPQGVATTLLATGPQFVWEDFINKRAIPQAQEEIRNLAYILKDYLFS